jgi:subtilase family protein
MDSRRLIRVALATGLCMTLIAGFAESGGRGAAGPPGGIGLPNLPSTARGPMDLPDPARGGRTEAMPEGAQRGLSIAAEARHAHEREMWHAHRDALDFDSDEHLIVRGEILALAPSPQALASAQAKGFAVRRQEALDGLDTSVIVLEAPRGMSLRRALGKLRSADPGGAYDYNHIYSASAAASPPAADSADNPRRVALKSSADASRVRRIGLIDGGVAAGHPALRSAVVHSHGCNGAPVPSEHGTAVASLLVATDEEPPGPAPKTELFAADVYCGAPTGGATDALIEALAWLTRERVPVINVSLVGPPNALLERAVDLAADRGYLIVAAVGNDGPAAPPLYPAAYPPVVAVTGVDRSERVLLEAERGRYVDFAALGADVMAATLPDGRKQVRGTSFAAPIVARLLAEQLDRPDRSLAEQAVRQLVASAVDLGARGYDPVYGNGFVGANPRATSAPVAQSQ